jgi:hypothetical protein
MIDEAAASRLFPSMKPAEAPALQPSQKPAPTVEERAARIYDASEPQAPQQQQKPPLDAKPGEQQQQQQQKPPLDPAVAQAAEVITSTLAEQGFDPAHADTTAFSSLAAELGITKDGAAKLAEWDQQRNQSAWDKLADDWHTEAKQDVLYQDNVTAGHALIQEFGDDRLMQEVIDLGFGSHPAVIGFMGRVGRALEQARRSRR